MKTRKLTIAAVLAVLASGAHTASGLTRTQPESELAALIIIHPNQQRSGISYSPLLHLAARSKAMDMARRGYCSHVDPDGYGPNFAVSLAGYSLPASYAQTDDANNIESIAAGSATPSETFSLWYNSPLHKRHVLGETDFFRAQTSYGVGHAYDANSPYRNYWVFLSAPDDAAARMRPYIEWQFVNLTAAQIAGSVAGDWRSLPWLGWFAEPYFPWIYHGEHGWMWWSGSSTSSIWFYTLDLGWLWTSANSYPTLYRPSAASWLRYQRGSRPRRFYNITTGEWETH